MNIFNLKRQIAGFMLMCGGGGSDGGGNSGDSEGGGTNSFTDESGQTYQFNGGNPAYGSESTETNTTEAGAAPYQSNGGQPMYGAESNNEQTYQSNGGQPMYGSDASPAEPRSINELSSQEKTARMIAGKIPGIGTALSTVESIGKFIQPGGSTLKRGETPATVNFNGGEDYIDEDGKPILKNNGLINSIKNKMYEPMNSLSGMTDSESSSGQNQQTQQQSYSTPSQSATPTAAAPSAGVSADMYGSGTGWGASMKKFAIAKKGATL